MSYCVEYRGGPYDGRAEEMRELPIVVEVALYQSSSAPLTEEELRQPVKVRTGVYRLREKYGGLYYFEYVWQGERVR